MNLLLSAAIEWDTIKQFCAELRKKFRRGERLEDTHHSMLTSSESESAETVSTQAIDLRQ